MRSLLKTSESRRLELIERLMIATDWMTLNQLLSVKTESLS